MWWCSGEVLPCLISQNARLLEAPWTILPAKPGKVCLGVISLRCCISDRFSCISDGSFSRKYGKGHEREKEFTGVEKWITCPQAVYPNAVDLWKFQSHENPDNPVPCRHGILLLPCTILRQYTNQSARGQASA